MVLRVSPRFDVEDPRFGALAWSRLVEPGDAMAGALVASLGVSEALRWLYDFANTDQPSIAAGQLGDDPGRVGAGAGQLGSDITTTRTPQPAMHKLAHAAQCWLTRLPDLDPTQDLRAGQRVGAQLLLPSDPSWPIGLADLGAGAPFALWIRGDPSLAERAQRSVSIVGSRASTHYGEQIAAELSAGLAERGFAVVSGGAYGVDSAAHRGCLAASGFTVAVLACGIDRMYPPGNTTLLRTIADQGALISELPPGAAPFRNRFLARNRLIAALSRATIVVEAAWRSGALSTARHAAALLRPVGAVPGPVTSMASGGCHQLVRDGVAVLITEAAEAAELAGSHGADVAEPATSRSAPTDGLMPEQKQVYDALPLSRYASATALVNSAGQPLPSILAALGILEARGLASTNGTGWRRTPTTPR